jgi:hypothetical protein
MTNLKKPGGVVMNGVYRLVEIAVAFMTVLCATLSFAQQDNVTIKRTAGDFYDITIYGERSGDFAEVQMVTTDTHRRRTAFMGVVTLALGGLFMIRHKGCN